MELIDWIRKAKKTRTEIRRKVHPSLPIVLRHYKAAITAGKALGKNPPHELLQKVVDRFHSQVKKALRKYPTLPVTFSDSLYSVDPPGQQGMLEFLHFNRHGRPLKADIPLAGSRDLDAWQRLIRTEHDFGVLYCGKGSVRPPKADPTHTDIFLFGVGMGLEALTKDELAEFFDKHCWCGRDHDGDALKKQYGRIIRNFMSCFPPPIQEPKVFGVESKHL